MRLALLLLLMAPARGDEVLSKETRAWKGVMTVRAVGRAPVGGRGGDEQTERIEFTLISKPSNGEVGLTMREAQGSYELSIDLREGEGAKAITTKGSSSGRLHPRVSGVIDPRAGSYRIRVLATPQNLVARATLSGMDRGRFATFRTAVTRHPLLAGFVADGKLEQGGRLIAGRRRFVDRKTRLERDVTITWRIERIDPVLKGRVVDHLGRPVPGVEVVARSTDPLRVKRKLPPLVRKGATDSGSRFAIDASWRFWAIELVAFEVDGVVFAPRGLKFIELRFDTPCEEELVMDAFRLRALPDPHLLRGHFRGDVGAYLAYVRPRAGEESMRLALVAPPGKR